MDLRRVVWVFSAFVSLAAAAAQASSIPGHVYSATAMLGRVPAGQFRTLLTNNRADYLTGAAGPDIAFVASDPKDRTSAGAESHYDQTGDLCIVFLKEARTDAEKAFALGWVSHWITDINIHTLVNAYGGNWEDKGKHHRHSQLEVTEVKHVYELARTDPALAPLVLDQTHVPAEYMNRVFGKLYGKAAYKPQAGPGGRQQAPIFETLLGKAAGFIETSTNYYKDACLSGTGKGSSSLMDLVMGTFNASVPSDEQYRDILRPLELGEPTCQGTQIVVPLNVHEARLYGKFLREWPAFMEQAAKYSEAVFRGCQAYMEATDKAKAVASLHQLLPNIDMDNPARSPALQARIVGSARLSQLADKTLRGDPKVQDLYLQSAAVGGEGKLQVLPRVSIAHLPESGVDKSRQGRVQVSVPLHAGRGQYRIALALGGAECLGQRDLADVEWVAALADGEPRLKVVGPAEVKATDVFALRAEVPAGMEGRVKWFRWSGENAGTFYTVPVNNHGPLTMGQFLGPWGTSPAAQAEVVVQGSEGPDAPVLVTGRLRLKVRPARLDVKLPARWKAAGNPTSADLALTREPEEPNPKEVRLFVSLSFAAEANFRPDGDRNAPGAGMDSSTTEQWPRPGNVDEKEPRLPIAAGDLKGICFRDEANTCSTYPRVGYLANGMFRIAISYNFGMNFLMGGPKESGARAWEERKRASKEVQDIITSLRVVEASPPKPPG